MDLAGPKVRTLQVHMPKAFLEREKRKRVKRMREAGRDPLSMGPLLLPGDRFEMTLGHRQEDAGGSLRIECDSQRGKHVSGRIALTARQELKR